MITICNKKILSFVPEWAQFRGFSYLFDHQDDNTLVNVDSVEQLRFLDCKENIDLYKALKISMDAIGGINLTNKYSLCPLPLSSYHVTVWDGINDSNLQKISQKHQEDFATFLEGLPQSFAHLPPFISTFSSCCDFGCICFRFKELQKFSNSVLVAVLEPADHASSDILNTIVKFRRRLDDEWHQKYQKPKNRCYLPHISLGYFANRQFAELATSRIGEWSNVFKAETDRVAICFNGISLYGFRDMVTFFK